MAGADERATVKPPTLYDVARAAGVSHQTVSRVVKGHTNIGAEIRQRIEAAIAELNYKPNLVARSLATNRPHRIGALVYELLASGPSKIMEGASIRAREAGYLLDIVSLDPENDGGISEAIGLITQSDLAGLMAFTPTDRVVQALRRTSFTVPVSLEFEFEGTDWSAEGEPSLGEGGVEPMIDYLAKLGHTRFFHIAGPEGWLAALGRSRAYENALHKRGLRSLGQAAGDWSARSGYEAGMRMPLDIGITAVVAANDQSALGVISALESRGVVIPRDMSVVGFDDIPESQFFHPPLTTVRFDFERQGRIAIDRLLARIPGAPALSTIEATHPQLVIRDSAAPPPPR
jgi:DNA-binding LacI/PurR family transcriptional regulator